MTDEELQDKIEKGLGGTTADERAYRRVFQALQREPSLKLSADFASRVISRIQTKPATSRDLVWMAVGIGSLTIALIVAIVLTGFSFNWGVFKFISGYPGLIVFGIAFILALQWIDKRIVRRTAA